MIPWDTFKTPQDAYEWAKKNFAHVIGPPADPWMWPGETGDKTFWCWFRGPRQLNDTVEIPTVRR